MYQVNWEAIQERYREFWARENHDRPLVMLSGRKGKMKNVPRPDTMEKCWLDTEYVIRNFRAQMEDTVYFGESYPRLDPNLGPDIFGASYGCNLVFEESTSFSVPFVEDWETFPPLQFDEENPWWKKILQMTRDIADDAKEEYFVGITDLHPGTDGLVSLRGPENLCMDLYDCPEQIVPRTKELLTGFCRQLELLYQETTRNLPGSSNWMGIWHPDKWYVTSSDFSGMLSEEMYEEFVLPELLEECRALGGNTIYHLDGPGALKHLDRLLEIPEIAGIQWVYGAGQPTASHWIEVYQKIQKAGKLIHTYVVPEDIDVLLEELKPEGVCLTVDGTFTEEEAREIMKKFE